jgi:predicted RNA-binding Zn-ribbon protein involved in translation (DUF1610 family)
MATMFEAVCKDCGHKFELLTGPTMTASQKVCEKCGKSVMVPSRAPAGSFELSKRELEEYLHSDDWDLYGRPFTEGEWSDLESLTRACQCGGRLITDDGEEAVKHRCPKCKSTALKLEFSGCAD